MTKDPNFVSVRLPDDVAIWLRDYATANSLIRADKPNMGGSIISVIRGVMNGQTMSNNVRQQPIVSTDKVEDSRLTELEIEIKRLNNLVSVKDSEVEAHKKEISNKTHKINDLQSEIQDYHRDQLEKGGISLPPRKETVLTLSGNFTQKQLDKAAKASSVKPATGDKPKSSAKGKHPIGTKLST